MGGLGLGMGIGLGLGLGVGYAAAPPIGTRVKKRAGGAEAAGEGEGEGEGDPSFGGLFSDGPGGAGAGAGGGGSSSSTSRRRKRSRYGSDDYGYGDLLDGKGSPLALSRLRAVTPEAGRQGIIRCNCRRSKCLKLYCDCLRVNKYCEGCNCIECNNSLSHAAARSSAVSSILERNPDAFKARISEDPLSMSKEHLQGCHCKKSACLKKYCECFSVSGSGSGVRGGGWIVAVTCWEGPAHQRK